MTVRDLLRAVLLGRAVSVDDLDQRAGEVPADLAPVFTAIREDLVEYGSISGARVIARGNGSDLTMALADILMDGVDVRSTDEMAIPSTVISLDTLLPLSARDLMTMDLPELEPIVAGILYPETVLVIGGLVKARKTWLVIQLCFSLISGTDFLSHEIARKHRVLYVGGEGSDRTIRKRLMLAAAHHPGIQEEDLDHLGIVSSLGRVKLDTPAGEEWLAKVSDGYEVIVVDPYYRFLSVGSENIHEDQRTIQDVFDRLKATGRAIVIAHHLRKPTGIDAGAAELRGAGMDAFADSILILSRKKVPVGDRFTIRYILRHDEEPRDLDLVPMGPLLQVAEDQSLVTVDDVVRVIREAGGRVDGRKTVEDVLMTMTGAGRDTCKKAIHRAENDRYIYSAKREGRGQSKTYILDERGIPGNEA